MEYLGQLASQGVLGIIVIVLYLENRDLKKSVNELQERRVADAQATIKGVIDPLERITDALDEQKTMFNTAFSAFRRSK